MSRLLKADFSRLFTYKPFIISCAVIALFSVYMNFGHLSTLSEPEYYIYPLELIIYFAFIVSSFISFFCGINFSESVIKNKLFAGHSKVKIYLSNAIVSVFVSCIFFILDITSIIWVVYNHKISWSVFFSLILAGAVVSIPFSAIATFITFICRGKAVPIVLSAVIVLSMLFSSARIKEKLIEPEYTDAIETIDGVDVDDVKIVRADAEMTFKKVKNPMYLSDKKLRRILTFIYEAMPTSQLFCVSSILLNSDYPDFATIETIEDEKVTDLKNANDIFSNVKLIYSVSFSIILTAAGVFIFRKEELK